MSNPFDVLDRCETKLAEAQGVIDRTRKVAAVIAGVAVAGGFGLLVWKVFGPNPEQIPQSKGND